MSATGTPSSLQEKILPQEEVFRRYGRPREGTVVFTNGCFDILHRGHVEYLSAARALGDLLIVGLNSDPSVRRLKGPSRPVNSEDDRAVVLAALSAVDVVTVFDDDTPHALISRLLPDVLVKGGDYRPENIVGAAEVSAAGGRVVVAPLVPDRSTSAVLQRLLPEDHHE
ncbi:MAG TPA: D-glycero-beta-D-manno-heptose 1-phosphate adenylyltransferase [Longimicrobiaceae bacterium]|nr:D-glycero-beta-D-manno-heptose 1-phosphate adenylyltransferase [Longimicrobiaceae bacterium]